MAEPYAILCVPVAGDPGGLLARGACCAFPPLVIRAWPPSSGRWSIAAAEYRHQRPPEDEVGALPLWWAGAPVPDGIFRAWNAWGPDATPDATGWTVYDVLAEPLAGSVGAAEWLARALESAGICRVVVLDLVGGVPVERAT